MDSWYRDEEITEKVILVCACLGGENPEESLDELQELADTAGAETVGRLVQMREWIDPGTYIGSGKIEELMALIDETGATGVICDDELSPAQLRNLEMALCTKVMDRTLLILDIFAGRATSSEGKLQVELAQLQYRLTRLVGLRDSLSRLGGGIGTRGPGESKLEMDRRYIRDRIAHLKHELKELQSHREITRSRRQESGVPVVAIVGYTNAGKSSLLNRLTGAGILAEDKLFATLDPTTRNMKLDSGQEILLTDTVGFIRKLPHHLVEAFKSTLEEAKYADIILHVVDVSNPRAMQQMDTVYKTLEDLGVQGKTIITLFNKQDRLMLGNLIESETVGSDGSIRRDLLAFLPDEHADKRIGISVYTGYGLDELKKTLEEALRDSQIYLERIYPYTEASKIAQIRKYGTLLSEEYEAEGIHVKAYVPVEWYERLI